MRILIVEDDSIIALCVEDALVGLGFSDIHIAGNLEMARQSLREAAPQFAVLDVNLGKETVFPFASDLAARHIPFIFSTGNQRSSFPAEWQAHLVVPKPMKSAELEAAIRAIGIAQTSDLSADGDPASSLP